MTLIYYNVLRVCLSALLQLATALTISNSANNFQFGCAIAGPLLRLL